MNVENNPNSHGFLYMDMQVYNEEEKNFDNVEIKEEEISFEENLPLNSIKNLANHSESNLEIFNNETKKRKSELSNNSDLGQKENVSLGNEELSGISRYKLRTRTLSNKFNSNLIDNKTINYPKCNKSTECSLNFSNKTKFLKSKKEKEFKCFSCKKFFCSEKMLFKHFKMCKKTLSKTFKNKFFCDKCKEIFNDKSQFEFHLNTHEKISLTCKKCELVFTEKIELEYHIIQNQCSTSNFYTCDICNKTFISFKTLQKHIIAHLNCFDQCKNSENFQTLKMTEKNEKIFCETCKKNLFHKEKFENYMFQHGQFTEKSLKGNKSFESEEFLEDHNRELKYATGNHKCEECSKIFIDNICYQEHLQTHKNNILKCENCNKMFLKLPKFSNHLTTGCQKSTPLENKCKFECDICGRKFNKLMKLRIHILNNHQKLNYKCEKCNKKFAGEEELKIHEKNNDCKLCDSYSCKTCGKVFAKRDYLKKHQYMHMNVLFKCKYCYCAFMKEKNFKKHMEKMNCSKSARKIRMAEYNFKKCRICAIEYETEELLIEHFNTSHSDQKPHQCFCCDSCLPTFRDLQNHIHHHNTQKYTCNLCGKPYTSQEGFRKHRLKHKGAEFKCRYCESEFLNEGRYKFHEKMCKKNPESGYEPSQNQNQEKLKKKDDRPKQKRQLHWESRIIMKHLRGDPQSSANNQHENGTNKNGNFLTSTFFDEPEETTNERGWFDNYYKTEEDDIAFGLKKSNELTHQSCDSDFDVTEFLQIGAAAKKKKVSANVQIANCEIDAPEFRTEKFSEDSSSESSEDSIEEVEIPNNYNPKKCRLCLTTFSQEYELLHHFIKTHPGEMAHKCPHCEVKSPLFAQLKEHMKTHGIGIGVYNCVNCSKKFKSEKKMKSHNVRCKGMSVEKSSYTKNDFHSEDQCKKCLKKFHTKFGYRRHKQLCKGRKSPKESNALEVSKTNDFIAQSSTDTNDFKVLDLEKEHSKSKLILQDKLNEKCDSATQRNEEKIFDFKESNKKIEKDSYIGEPPLDSFPCRLCDKKFQYERGIVMHFKSAHPGNKPLICHVCNMHLADKLKEHLKTHGIGEEFICELCGKRFNQKFLSKIHEMWHQGIEYKCNNCKQKFLNKEKMEKHIGENRCSNRQSLMRLPCDICGKSYRSKFGLSKHYITHTPKELRPVKNRMNCEYCGKWFENNNGLQRHRRIHTGERPFCCRFCPKAFAQEGNCKAHERIHTGESKPRKKKAPPSIPPPSTLQAPSIPVDSISYPTHINLYIYNNIDSNGVIR